MDDLTRIVQDLLKVPSGMVMAAAVALGIVVVLWLVWKALHRRRPVATVGTPQLAIDVASLGDAGPPPGPPILEFYNIPVRVAAVVLAPAGRVCELPPPSELPRLFDAIVPGLDTVIAAHNPLVRRWPTQVSARGFAHIFFGHVRLPGDAGKGTPWSSAAGIVKLEGHTVMAGLVLRAARANSFGHMIIDSEEKWLGCLRVREQS
jgi:hypothetical protein